MLREEAQQMFRPLVAIAVQKSLQETLGFPDLITLNLSQDLKSNSPLQTSTPYQRKRFKHQQIQYTTWWVFNVTRTLAHDSTTSSTSSRSRF
ncbi:hypothetical protein TNCV_4957861 [Trichonephila clavipes]|nr:hypothetical protein TNCV_4957861 [Trichonephila clavipes]